MEEIELSVFPTGMEEQLVALIEGAAEQYGLQIRMRGTLRTYPGSQHWHFQKPGERGTLEITLWPAGKRVWFSVQARRRAAWITEILPLMKAWIEGQLSQPQK
jgi:hypothetical protein